MQVLQKADINFFYKNQHMKFVLLNLLLLVVLLTCASSLSLSRYAFKMSASSEAKEIVKKLQVTIFYFD